MSIDITGRINNITIESFVVYVHSAYDAFLKDAGEFYRAVNWSEVRCEYHWSFYGVLIIYDTFSLFFMQNWIMGILITHVILFLLILKERKNPSLQFSLLAVLCVIVFSMRQINDYLRENWKHFGWSQNYFDESGIFLTVLVSVPLVFLAIVQTVSILQLIPQKLFQFLLILSTIQINSMIMMSSLMVEYKTMKIRDQKKRIAMKTDKKSSSNDSIEENPKNAVVGMTVALKTD